MKNRVLAVALATMISATAAAHDFWLQPLRFQTPPGVPWGATFLVGHGAFRERWDNNDRIVLLQDFSVTGRRDLRPDLRAGGSADLVTRFATDGVHVVVMQSNDAFSSLPAIRFDDYAKVEGLRLIEAHRRNVARIGTPGRERYSRRAKSLIQVGTMTGANQRLSTRAIGLKLEIVPDRNPYALGTDRMLPLHVLFNGRRLANATVKLTDLASDSKPVAIGLTDRSGRVRFKIPSQGNWLINVVWGEPVRGDANADYETTFSSLTFGYPAAPTRRN